jgi:hypothetical protein
VSGRLIEDEEISRLHRDVNHCLAGGLHLQDLPGARIVSLVAPGDAAAAPVTGVHVRELILKRDHAAAHRPVLEGIVLAAIELVPRPWSLRPSIPALPVKDTLPLSGQGGFQGLVLNPGEDLVLRCALDLPAEAGGILLAGETAGGDVVRPLSAHLSWSGRSIFPNPIKTGSRPRPGFGPGAAPVHSSGELVRCLTSSSYSTASSLTWLEARNYSCSTMAVAA